MERSSPVRPTYFRGLGAVRTGKSTLPNFLELVNGTRPGLIWHEVESTGTAGLPASAEDSARLAEPKSTMRAKVACRAVACFRGEGWRALVDDLRTLSLAQIPSGIPHIGELSLLNSQNFSGQPP